MKIAIIGAGMAGLSSGVRLLAEGHEITVVDKGRGPGGRMATRRAEVGGDTVRFDHGAQYFTVSDDRFAEQVAAWEEAGVVARWPADKDAAYVGTPAMNAPIKAMASELDVHFGVRVESVGQSGSGWRLDGEGVLDTVYDALLIAVPAEQAGPLLIAQHPEWAELAKQTISDPCWTVMAAFDAPIDHADTMCDAGAIGWAARNSAKPGRGDGECWVIQASPEWSRDFLEDNVETVIGLLLGHFRDAVGGNLPETRHTAAHRWRFAISGAVEGDGALWDSGRRIGVCGDWLVGPRVECAFLSGVTLANKVGGNA